MGPWDTVGPGTQYSPCPQFTKTKHPHGAPDRTRTCDPRLRRPLLYPPELLAHSTHHGAMASTPERRRNSRYLHLGLSSPRPLLTWTTLETNHVGMNPLDEKPNSTQTDDESQRHDPVQEAREIVDFTARKVRSARDFVRTMHSPYLGALLIIYLLAAIWGSWTVFATEFRDWYMYSAMFLVSFVFLLLYIKAHYQRRSVIKAVAFVANIALHSYWIWVLYDRIPARRVWYRTDVVLRPEVTGLWGPMILIALVVVGIIAHYAAIGRMWDRAEPSA